MKNVFANTKNVKKATQLAQYLINRPPKTPGMALVYSASGLGKTEWALNWIARTGTTMVQLKATSNALWFLSELVMELGGDPESSTRKLYGQAVELIMKIPPAKRLILVDEIDEVMKQKIVLTIKNLYDQTGCAFLLIGMQNAERRLRNFQAIYSRLGGNICEFEEFNTDDVLEIASQLLEGVVINKEAASAISELSHSDLRVMCTLFYAVEQWAKRNNKDTITAREIKEIVKK